MIELLGLGVRRDGGNGWLLHRVCTQLGSGELVAVVSRDPAERRALLDAVAGRRQPDEGRVYVGRVPITRETVGKLRARVGDADLTLALEESRSVLWNVLAGRRPGVRALLGLFRLPRRDQRQAALAALGRADLVAPPSERVSQLDGEARARLVIARELARHPEYLAVHDLDLHLGGGRPERLLETLGLLAHGERLGVLASLDSWALARVYADRIIALAGGLLVFDGPPASLTGDLVSRRLGGALPG